MSGGTTASFQYDAAGRRIGKTIGTVSTGYLYDGANFVQEKSGTASGASVTANLLTGGIDEVFERETTAGNQTMLTDALGSTLLATDGTAATVTSYGYDAYGKTTQTGTNDNSQQYTGRENDQTGLYFYRARYYSPALGRFISSDPIGWASGQTNNYAYVDGNPLGRVDPEGLDWRSNLGEIAVCLAYLYGGNRVPAQTSQPPRPIPMLPTLPLKLPKCE